jgi:HD superfamily phosphohydrolase
VLRIAALVHDVTHIPFGHHIEDQTGLIPRHDTEPRIRAMLNATELGDVLAELGVRDAVQSVLLEGRGEGAVAIPAFWFQLVSDTICADILDYLKRDAYFTGLNLFADPRLLRYFKIDRTSQRLFVDCEKEGMVREDNLSEILRMLEARYYFSERVYYHHAKIAAGALISRTVELALRSGAVREADLYVQTDHSLLELLARTDLGDGVANQRAKNFLERYHRRALPKRAAVLPFYLNADCQAELVNRFFAPRAQERRFAWEAEREAEARSRFGREVEVILYCPAREMQLKEARSMCLQYGNCSSPSATPTRRRRFSSRNRPATCCVWTTSTSTGFSERWTVLANRCATGRPTKPSPAWTGHWPVGEVAPSQTCEARPGSRAWPLVSMSSGWPRSSSASICFWPAGDMTR